MSVEVRVSPAARRLLREAAREVGTPDGHRRLAYAAAELDRLASRRVPFITGRPYRFGLPVTPRR